MGEYRLLERIIPDIHSQYEVPLVRTPSTHKYFPRRYWESRGLELKLKSIISRIGLPAVAARSMIVTNTLTFICQHSFILQAKWMSQ